ncbi:MAG: hypothetical protein AB8B91_23500 [Rubripirellula sp.]
MIQQINGTMQSSTKPPETVALELSARAVLDLDQELTEWFVETDNLLQEDHPAWKKSREKRLRDASKRIREYTQEAQRIQQYAQAIFGEAMTVGIVADGMALRRSLRPMLDQQVPLPPQRFPRYLIVVEGRMAAIEEMIESHAEALPDSTKSHLRNWHRWVDNWTSRLEAAAKDPPKIDAFRALIAQFDNELNNQVSHAMIDGRLPSSLTNMLREIRIQIGPLSDQVRAMAKHGDSAQKSKAQIAREDESDKVAEYTRDEKYSAAAFDRRRAMVLERLQEEESIHRNRPAVDLQYAADMTLMSNAIENVAQEGYQPYKEEKPAEVFQKLGYAFQTIEAKHEADLWLGELQSLLLAERKLEPTASAKIKHATWLERFSSGLEWPVRTLKNVRIDNELIQAIDQPRYNQDFSQARERITSRRWGGPEMLTAEAPIDSLQRDLSQGLDAIVPKVTEARQTIQQYVLSLAEQAREAAEKADEAKERTDTRPDQKQETAEQLQTEQEEAEQAAEETMEALVDIANTADITDAEAREVARDADAAAAQIQDAKERAEEAAKQAAEASEEQARGEALEKTEEALEDLADALRDTAEHFEKLENGEDVSESREQLRQAEEELQIQDQLQQRQDQAEAMANAAQQSPQEMLEQLERELQDNEPMQEELSEIAERAADAAQKTLEEAARKETSLNQQLERSDQSFQERKRQKALQIQQLAHRASTVDQAMLNATERAVGWANTPRARPKLEEAREQLREAVQKANQMGGDQALLPKMNQTAKEMANALKAASEAIEDVKQQSEDAQDKNIHKDDRSRKQAKEQLERFERDARTQNGRGANTEKQRWSAYERDAGRRVQQAQSQKRSFEKQVDKIEDRLKKEKNENSRKQLTEQQAQYEQRVADAESNEKAAMETRDFAKQMGKAADDRKRESDRQKLTPLNEKNPAAELANRMSSQAQEELNKLQQELREVAKETEFGQELQVAPDQASSLAKQQQRIEQDVKDAAEQLRRAARHEERLGQEQLAQQLDAAAEAVAGEAAEAAAEATEALQQAAQDAQQAPAASREVAEAGKSISDVAEQLAQLLNGMTEQNAEATEATSQSPAENAEEGGESQQRAEQMAQTLDELDRSIAQSQSESQQQGQQQPGEQPGQQSGQEPGQQTAADASQTVANAMDAQSQRSARQRQQQMDPSQGQGQPGEEQSPNMPGSKPGNESGMPGQMPSGGMVDTRGVQRADGAWGQLRERTTDDAAQSRSATISPQFRREIEAYFRAVAKRAAETSQ